MFCVVFLEIDSFFHVVVVVQAKYEHFEKVK